MLKDKKAVVCCSFWRDNAETFRGCIGDTIRIENAQLKRYTHGSGTITFLSCSGADYRLNQPEAVIYET